MYTTTTGGEYGSFQDGSVGKFRADFELVCNNALAFHRPNERCHALAKRMLRFGRGVLDTTFPWSQTTDVGDGDVATTAAASEAAADGGGEGESKPEEVVASPWHHRAAVTFELADTPRPRASCFVCGGRAEKGDEAPLLHCSVCAEAYHYYCTPPPCPEVNEDTLVHWTCARCAEFVTSKGANDAGADASHVRCFRCDRAYPKARASGQAVKDGDGGAARWVCSDCRFCESCGARSARGWSDDGLWCAECAGAGRAEKFCAICAKVCED